MPESFYERIDDNRYLSTDLTIGPWGPDSQHGGPPAALLGSAMETVAAHSEMHLARATFEILKPIPVVPVEVRAEVVRSGKRVELLEASLTVERNTVMRASGWRIRTTELDLQGVDPLGSPPSKPEDGEAVAFFETGTRFSYFDGLEWRFVTGSFFEPGRSQAWIRMRHPLVAGEAVSPVARVLVAADSGSGMSSELDFRRWIFINPDLTVYLTRPPSGEWIHVDARMAVDVTGIGLATTSISDEKGGIGRGLQSLLIDERP